LAELERVWNYGASKPSNMSNAYKLSASCQANKKEQDRDLAAARKLEVDAQRRAQRVPSKAGKAKSAPADRGKASQNADDPAATKK
jgi:hypothetical protein